MAVGAGTEREGPFAAVTHGPLSLPQLAVGRGGSTDGPGGLSGYRWVWLPRHGRHQRTQDEVCPPQGVFQRDWYSRVPQVGGAAALTC